MIRRSLLLSLAALFALSSQLTAEETYQQWLTYLEGTWKFQAAGGPSGQLKFQCLKGDHAAIVRGTSEGKTTVSLVGWRADEKVLVDTMHSEDGTYSVVTYDSITDQEMRGKMSKATGEFAALVGAEVVVTKKDRNTISAAIESEDGSVTMTAEYKRFDPVRSPLRAPKARAEEIDEP